MKKILLILLIALFSSSIFASDDKPGRFFEDQPDVNDDFQIHVIFSLYADSEDNEEDINGKWEQWIKIADDSIFKMTEKANKKTIKAIDALEKRPLFAFWHIYKFRVAI